MPTIFSSQIPPYVLTVCETLNQAGHEAYVVGGALRDIALGLTPKDFDVTTNAVPDQVETLFTHTAPTGKKYGTITLIFGDGLTLEVTTFRSDSAYTDGRRPDYVTFSHKLEDDLARRDFTINAIAYDPVSDTIYDPFNGLADVDSRILRTVGSAHLRISEDALRMMRAVRIKAEKGFTMTDELSLAIKSHALLINNVSQERIAEELCRIIMSDRPTEALYDLRDLDLLRFILPELQTCVGVNQRQDYHKHDVFGHIAHALRYADKDLVVRLAVLFHDIGKPLTYSIDQKGIIHFYGHEVESARLVADILDRFKFSNYLKNSIIPLVRQHMRNVDSAKALRRLMSILKTPEQARRFAQIRFADKMGGRGETVTLLAGREKLLARMEKIWEEKVPLKISDLSVTGNDVIKHLGLNPGPKVGAVLNHLLRTVIDDPELNKQEILLPMIPKAYEDISTHKFSVRKKSEVENAHS